MRAIYFAAAWFACAMLAVWLVTELVDWAVDVWCAPRREPDAPPDPVDAHAATVPADDEPTVPIPLPEPVPAVSGCLCPVDCWTKPCATYQREHAYR